MTDARIYLADDVKLAYLDGLTAGIRESLNTANTHAALLAATKEVNAEGAYAVADELYFNYCERKAANVRIAQCESGLPLVIPAS